MTEISQWRKHSHLRANSQKKVRPKLCLTLPPLTTANHKCPVNPPRTEQSTPQNTDIALRNSWHMKLRVKYKGPDVFVFTISRSLFSKEWSQTEYSLARSFTTHLKITTLPQIRFITHIVWKSHWFNNIVCILLNMWEQNSHALRGVPALTTGKQAGSSCALQCLENLRCTSHSSVPCIFKTRHVDYCILNNSYLYSKYFVFLSLLLQSAN